MAEVWKDIQGYEGIYQVSNLGRVRSLDRYVPHSRLGKFTGAISHCLTGKTKTAYGFKWRYKEYA